MTNILTAAEAAAYIRTDADDPAMLQLLNPVDAYLEAATGRDWAADATIHPLAKTAAGILLASWYDDPAQVGSSPSRGSSTLLQLEVEGLKYRKYTFFGSNGAGGLSIPGVLIGDDVIKLVGVYGSSGDQSSKFESVVTATGALQQTDGGDLSGNLYVAVFKSPAEDVTA